MEMSKDLTIMEGPLEPLLPMEVSKNLLSSVAAVEAACMACVLLPADFSNSEALYSAVKLSQSVDLSSTGGTLEMLQLVEVAKNIWSLGTAGMVCILLPGDSWDSEAVYMSVELSLPVWVVKVGDTSFIITIDSITSVPTVGWTVSPKLDCSTLLAEIFTGRSMELSVAGIIPIIRAVKRKVATSSDMYAEVSLALMLSTSFLPW